MIKDLISLANHLDAKGLRKEADYLDGIIKRANEDSGIFDKLTDLLQNDEWYVANSVIHSEGESSMSATKGAEYGPEGHKRLDIKLTVNRS